MALRAIYPWTKAPFLRLLLPFIAGIMLQWHIPFTIQQLLSAAFVAIAVFSLLSFLPAFTKFRLPYLKGIIINIILCCAGAILTWQKNIQNNSRWFGKELSNESTILATLQEPLVEKPNSFKAVASVKAVFNKDSAMATTGKIIIYFKKDSTLPQLNYGSQLVFRESLQVIRNTGNPGAFDYRRYCFFQGITHQVYLRPADFQLSGTVDENRFKKFLFKTRKRIVDILNENTKGEKEQGLAAALLIGYKDGLDKELVQSYSNTGVVHVIAISGLHLGLIYAILVLIFKPFRKRKKSSLPIAIVIISSLWIFSFLAGAQPSVLRSALMFTCIVLGESFSKRSPILNSLAASAFLLLCYNPYWLWDAGFQLSYSAVLSIVIFMKPIYNLFFIKNRILDFAWKLNAITLSAQILTAPVSLFHFNQFPNYFLLANLVAVPLSSLILIGELLLCAVSFIPEVCAFVGNIITIMIRVMNSWIEKIDALPFATWEGIQLNFAQVVLMFMIILGFAVWLFEKKKGFAFSGLASLLLFFAYRSRSFVKTQNQQIMVIYNIPRHSAMALISGNIFRFIGDEHVLKDQLLYNFHIKPSCVKYRINTAEIQPSKHSGRCLGFNGKKIVVLNEALRPDSFILKEPIDVLVLTGDPRIYFNTLNRLFPIRKVVFDSSVPARKKQYWKNDCDSLNIPWHDVTDNGAFVMKLN